MAVTARRIIDHPIIDQGMSPVIGDNINGPTLIRVPDWVQRPLGRYYLYFAHHEGRSIRLAYADSIFGPWSIYEPGALALENSLFPGTQDMIEPDGGSDPFAALGTIDYVPHIASPDVLIDPANRRFLMYFHGLTENGDQMTRLAISADGLNFHAQVPLFEHYYYRVFLHGDRLWAISWGGRLYVAEQPEGPFRRGPSTFEIEPISPQGRPLRHLGLLRNDDRLHLFFSRIGDTPEVILYAAVTLADEPTDWKIEEPREILRPELPWEGVDLPITTSRPGLAVHPEHALRDPGVFRDNDGTVFMLYSGAGEQAIGIVELMGL